MEILTQLAEVLEQRKSQDPQSSYVASLYAKGLDAILKKIGEEATETVMAAKDGVPDKIVHEVADLWFHTLVLLAYRGLRPEQVLAELQRRFGSSGLEEKAARAPGEREKEGPALNGWSSPVFPSGREIGEREPDACESMALNHGR